MQVYFFNSVSINVAYLTEVFPRCEGTWPLISRWTYWLEKYCMESAFEKFLQKKNNAVNFKVGNRQKKVLVIISLSLYKLSSVKYSMILHTDPSPRLLQTSGPRLSDQDW